ncbi:hypothetical protein [Candidatus Frankia alpina]|nr:hypothetical protein [Candidatus Frankia alpina]
MRAEVEQVIRPIGRERRELLSRLNEIDKELRPLVLAALEVEISVARLGGLTGLARNTISAWKQAVCD